MAKSLRIFSSFMTVGPGQRITFNRISEFPVDMQKCRPIQRYVPSDRPVSLRLLEDMF